MKSESPLNLDAPYQALDRGSLEQYVLSAVHRMVAHYALWFRETIHQMGERNAFRIEENVWKQVWDNHVNRLGKVLGFEVRDGLPVWIETADDEQLKELIKVLSVNWLAIDGLWFQAIEHAAGMTEAKLANDTCWGRFSPMEAREIRRLANLPEDGGIQALKTALSLRLYARLNIMSVHDNPDGSITLRVNECRVQSARNRKGLPDYPCKSGGTMEYTYFAKEIDPRIRTVCESCPPDPHPGEWYCSWRFEFTS